MRANICEHKIGNLKNDEAFALEGVYVLGRFPELQSTGKRTHLEGGAGETWTHMIR